MSKTLGALIREVRTSRQMSVRRVAAAAGLSPSTLSNWETDKAQPRMPELDAVLDALQCPEALRLEIYACIDAPRAVARLREVGRSASDDRETARAWFPSSGDLLRSLRLRRHLSLEQASAILRVQPSTISRWETSKLRLSESCLDAYCAFLAVYPEERQALRKVFLQLPDDPDRPSPSRDALEHRLEQLHADIIRGGSQLLDLRLLTLETHLSKRACRNAWAWHLLLRSYIWHAQWLQWQDRIAESGQIAQRALQMMSQETHPHPSWFRAVLTYSNYLVEGMPSPRLEYGMRFLLDWLPVTHQSSAEAWIYNNIAIYQVRMGRVHEALQSVEKANHAAERTGRATTIRNTHYDSAVVLLSAGRAEEVQELLAVGEQPNIYHRITEAHVWAATLRARGDSASACQWFQCIDALIAQFALPCSYSRRFRQQFSLPKEFDKERHEEIMYP